MKAARAPPPPRPPHRRHPLLLLLLLACIITTTSAFVLPPLPSSSASSRIHLRVINPQAPPSSSSSTVLASASLPLPLPIPPPSPSPTSTTIIITSRLRIANLCCSAEEALIHNLLTPLPGVQGIRISAVGRVAIIRHTPATSTALLLTTLNDAHLGASLQDVLSDDEDDKSSSSGSSSSSSSSSNSRGLLSRLRRPFPKIAPWLPLLLAGTGWLISFYGHTHPWPRSLLHALPLPCLLLASLPLLLRVVRAGQRKQFTVDFLMATAVIGALLLGDVSEALEVVGLVAVAERVKGIALGYVEKLVEGTGGRLSQTQVARVVVGGECSGVTAVAAAGAVDSKGIQSTAVEIPLSRVRIGDVVLVRAGEAAPVDGQVLRGEAVMDESALTGECMPVKKQRGSQISGGSICQAGAVEVECTALASESSRRLVQQMVQDIATTRGPSQVIVDRFASIYTPLLLLLALTVAIHPPLSLLLSSSSPPPSTLLLQTSLKRGLYRSLELLVLACPCALAMASSLPFLTTLAGSATHGGVLFKSASALETLGHIQVMACDKTGTLTEGHFQVTDRLVLSPPQEEEEEEIVGSSSLPASFSSSSSSSSSSSASTSSSLPPSLVRLLAASVEDKVAHRLSSAIVADALGCVAEQQQKGKTLARVSNLVNIEGIGVQATCVFDQDQEGREGGREYVVAVGNEGLLSLGGSSPPSLPAFLAAHPGEAYLYVLVDGQPSLLLSLSDALRPQTAGMLEALREEGVEAALLTGDSEEVALAIRGRVGGREVLPTVVARMKPLEKLQWVQRRQQMPPPKGREGGRKGWWASLGARFGLGRGKGREGGREGGHEHAHEHKHDEKCGVQEEGDHKHNHGHHHHHHEEKEKEEQQQQHQRHAHDHGHDDCGPDGCGATDDEHGHSHSRPQQKEQLQQQQQQQQCLVAMIGDGINDGPCLQAADVGIAMGQHGTALAVAAADVILLSDNLTRIPQAMHMSRATQRVVKQNLALALGLKMGLVASVLLAGGRGGEQGGGQQLWKAVAVDGLSLVLVLINGMRPLWLAKRIFRKEEEGGREGRKEGGI